MKENSIFLVFLIVGLVIGAVVFAALFFIRAPYGRHFRKGWGPSLSARTSWILMEAPSAIGMLVLFVLGSAPKTTALYAFLMMWEAHYIHRAFIYPFQIADGRKRWPVVVLAMGFFFNLGNSFLNGRYLFSTSGASPSTAYTHTWLVDARFLAGLALFLAGFIINRWADGVLQGLRRPGETGYKIPYGGLYRWISCPNYLGEIIEWCGWALATWSLPGLAFAAWTISNLAPRARANHAWYHEHFNDYPPQRKALLPGLW